jgi:glycosyltransferase involved in cell wall biosynthesis
MKICLVGGIFDRDAKMRSKHVVTPETVLLDGFQKAGVEVHAVGHAGFEPSDDYDVIHVHHFGKAALKMAASNCEAKFVFTGHNGLIVTGYERNWARRRTFQYAVDKADAFVALSHAEEGFFEKHGAAGKAHCIPNGIPSEFFRTNIGPGDEIKKQTDKDRFRILYVGQLIDWKGVNFLLEALQQVRLRHNARLRLVYHNAELERELKQMVQDLGIAEAVEFVGILGPSELAREYYEADLLVLPSFADCLPSVVTEAFLCGTPVVAGGVCGVPEQLDQYGIPIPPGDVPALVTAIESMICEQPRYQALATEMRDYAEKKYHPTAMVEGHLALYRQLMAEPNSKTRRKSHWTDPLVRMAIAAYWSRGRKNKKGSTP